MDVLCGRAFYIILSAYGIWEIYIFMGQGGYGQLPERGSEWRWKWSDVQKFQTVPLSRVEGAKGNV